MLSSFIFGKSIQLVIDLALSLCVSKKLGTPSTYADAFLKLAEGGMIEKKLAIGLVHVGFRNRIVHAYEKLDMGKVYSIAKEGPKGLIAFLEAATKMIY